MTTQVASVKLVGLKMSLDAGILFPVVMTDAAYETCVGRPVRDGFQSAETRLAVILRELRDGIEDIKPGPIQFAVVTPVPFHGKRMVGVKLVAELSIADGSFPTFTISLLSESNYV